MFVSGQSRLASMVFSALTYTVAIPSAIKVFNWVATLYKGSIQLRTPMLYALSFILLFTIGGLTGIFLGALNIDVHLHDTYFVVAHFHYVMMGSALIAFFGALHYWYPKMFGKMYNETVGTICAVIIFFAFNLTFLPQFVMGAKGMARRYFDYDPEFKIYHQLSIDRRLHHGHHDLRVVRQPGLLPVQGQEGPGQPLGRHHHGVAGAVATPAVQLPRKPAAQAVPALRLLRARLERGRGRLRAATGCSAR